jgi:uncharacterized protein YdaU (DUF1376 family)
MGWTDVAIQKPEWFKMDPAKFLSDAQVDVMTTLELGACFRLMCRQWLDGFIPDDQKMLARLCRLDAAAMAEAWITLSHFFPIVESGKRANRFMWIERAKVVADLERKSDEGTKAARKRWDDVRNKRDAIPNGSPMPDPMQDQTRAEQSRPEKSFLSEQSCSDEMTQPSKKPKPEPSRDATKLVVLLKAEILRNSCEFKITQAQERNWAVIADRMLRLDGRKPEQAAELIRWAQRDEFWMRNVLSMEKLRKQFDRLALEAKVKTNGKSSAPVPLPADYVSPSKEILRERAAAVAQ